MNPSLPNCRENHVEYSDLPSTRNSSIIFSQAWIAVVVRSILADGIQGPGQLGLNEKITVFRQFVARLAYESLTFWLKRQALCSEREIILAHGRNPDATLGIPDRGSEQVTKRQMAKPVAHSLDAGHKSGDQSLAPFGAVLDYFGGRLSQYP